MKMRRASSRSSFRRNGRGVSPAISTVMLTSAIVVLLLVTIGFANKARMVVPKFVRVVSFYSYLASCADGGVA